ncbi:MAG TPA: tryptophan 7-halogenase [Thermoanaerobaculia bacterium]|nr:tryptophan 7-halogenase [Thermoanaerobaculia bacterium]
MSPASSSPQDPSSPVESFDVVIVGGAFAGASSALLLLRERPQTRVLVVERSERFGSKVGEATVEVSGLFIQTVLGLERHLAEAHLPKHGLRFWFTDGPDRSLAEMTEIGPGRPPDLPSFQLDRARLDQHLLEQAVAAGARLLRPARVSAVEEGWPQTRVTVTDAAGAARTVSCRWLIDASGRFAYLGRSRNLLRNNHDHPTAAAWARWHGVADLDGPAILGDDPEHPRIPRLRAVRRYATNHFCGYGWWAWVIPLASGRTSVGLVWDRRLFDPPGSGDVRDRAEAFLRIQPGLRELLADATVDPGDRHAYAHLAYRTERYADRGWAMVGDAAAFIDPYYSPGLDHCSISVFATVRLIGAELAGRLEGESLEAAIARHNGVFARSYDRWFDALYRNKYELLGDADLVSAAFLVETALYYLGVVTPAYRRRESLENAVFGLELPQARIAYRLARGFSRRLVALAAIRRRTGVYGRRNVGRRLYIRGFALGRGALPALGLGLRIWARTELETLAARLRLLPAPTRASQPAGDPAS